MYRTAEANYRQTRSVVRPVCNSRATCTIHVYVHASSFNCLFLFIACSLWQINVFRYGLCCL